MPVASVFAMRPASFSACLALALTATVVTGCENVTVLHGAAAGEGGDADMPETAAQPGEQRWAGGGEFWSRGDDGADRAVMTARCPSGYRVDARVAVPQQTTSTSSDAGAVVAGAFLDVGAFVLTRGRWHRPVFTETAAIATQHAETSITEDWRIRYACTG